MLGTILFFSTMKDGPNITLKISCERLEIAASKIGSAIGIPNLKVSRKLKDTVVYISLKETSRKEFDSQLSEVLNATVIEKNGQYWIDQTPQQEIAEQKAYADARDDQIEKVLRTFRERNQSLGDFDDKKAKKINQQLKDQFLKVLKDENSNRDPATMMSLQKLTNETPHGRLVSRIMSSFKVEDFKSLNLDQPTIVFSSNPNPLQKPINIDWKKISNQWEEENTIWTTHNPAQKPDSKPVKQAGTYFIGPFPMSYAIDNDGSMSSLVLGNGTVGKEIISRVVLSAHYGQTFFLDLLIFDQSNRLIIRDRFLDWSSPELPKVESKPEEPLKDDFLKFLTTSKTDQDNRKLLTAEITDQLLQPETIDPLSISYPKLIKRYVGDKNAFMIASDTFLFDQKFSTAFQQRAIPYIFKETDQWVTFYPKDRISHRSQQADRSLIGKHFRKEIKRSKSRTIEDYYRFAADIYGPAQYNNVWRILDLFSPTSSKYVMKLDILAVLGSLSETDWANASRPQGVQVSLLSGNAIKRLQQMFFHQSLFGEPSQPISSTSSEPTSGIGFGDPEAFYLDPRHTFPTGFDQTTTIRIDKKVTSLHIVKAGDSWRQISVPQLAFAHYRSLHPDRFNEPQILEFTKGIDPKNIELGDSTKVTMVISSTRTARKFVKVVENEVTPSGKTSTPDQLDQTRKKELEDYLKRIEEMWKKSKGGSTEQKELKLPKRKESCASFRR